MLLAQPYDIYTRRYTLSITKLHTSSIDHPKIRLNCVFGQMNPSSRNKKLQSIRIFRCNRTDKRNRNLGIRTRPNKGLCNIIKGKITRTNVIDFIKIKYRTCNRCIYNLNQKFIWADVSCNEHESLCQNEMFYEKQKADSVPLSLNQ